MRVGRSCVGIALWNCFAKRYRFTVLLAIARSAENWVKNRLSWISTVA